MKLGRLSYCALITLLVQAKTKKEKTMTTVVLFYKDGNHELMESQHGIKFTLDNLNLAKMDSIYIAKSKSDAQTAIHVFNSKEYEYLPQQKLIAQNSK